MINNVVIIYRVHMEKKLVSIETCYSALTGEVAELFPVYLRMKMPMNNRRRCNGDPVLLSISHQ
jgi:hypothetical protein